MNTTTTSSVRVIDSTDGSGEHIIDAASLRRLADLSEMIGHPIVATCEKGFEAAGELRSIEYRMNMRGFPSHAVLQIAVDDGDTRPYGVCGHCKVSVVMDLGTVTA